MYNITVCVVPFLHEKRECLLDSGGGLFKLLLLNYKRLSLRKSSHNRVLGEGVGGSNTPHVLPTLINNLHTTQQQH